MTSELLAHVFPFDPTYGYRDEDLLNVTAPPEPDDLAEFWQWAYRQTIDRPPRVTSRRIPCADPALDLFEVEFDSGDGLRIGGWLTVPRNQRPRRGVVLSHGYGGREGPDLVIPGPSAIVMQPCIRGFNRSATSGLPDQAAEHVLHGIESRETYIHLGCVMDHWAAATALLELFPDIANALHFIGGSFGGGIGAMALAWDPRFHAASLKVPSFGNHPLRVTLPCTGSGEAVRRYHRRHPEVLNVLRYFDAATLAQRITIPTHFACARFDPAVPPPGQFAVCNAAAGPKRLTWLRAGHFEHSGAQADEIRLFEDRRDWFERCTPTR